MREGDDDDDMCVGLSPDLYGHVGGETLGFSVLPYMLLWGIYVEDNERKV